MEIVPRARGCPRMLKNRPSSYLSKLSCVQISALHYNNLPGTVRKIAHNSTHGPQSQSIAMTQHTNNISMEFLSLKSAVIQQHVWLFC